MNRMIYWFIYVCVEVRVLRGAPRVFQVHMLGCACSWQCVCVPSTLIRWPRHPLGKVCTCDTLGVPWGVPIPRHRCLRRVPLCALRSTLVLWCVLCCVCASVCVCRGVQALCQHLGARGCAHCVPPGCSVSSTKGAHALRILMRMGARGCPCVAYCLDVFGCVSRALNLAYGAPGGSVGMRTLSALGCCCGVRIPDLVCDWCGRWVCA